MRVKSLMLALALLLVGCSEISGPWSRNDLREFVRARQRWEARSFDDYSYEIRTSCFCPIEIGLWTRVTVRDGVVVETVQVEPNPDFPITVNLWQPIDSLFSRLHRTMGESGFSSHFASLEVDYDRELGYPVYMRYTVPTVADGDWTIEARNVVPLN